MRVRNTSALFALVVLAVAPAGGAASPATSFTDIPGDSLSAPDLTAINVSNDTVGAVTFKITLANRPGVLNADDGVFIWIDSDRNPATDGPRGDYVITLKSTGPLASKWDGTDYLAYSHGPISGSYSGGIAVLTVNKADIGNPAAFDFFALTQAVNSPGHDFDRAPESGVFSYTLTLPVVAPVTIATTRVLFTAAAPKAGKVFGVTGVTLGLSNKTSTRVSPVRCTAKVAGKALKPVAKCRWKLAAKSKRKKLVISVSISYKGQARAVKPASFKIK